MSRINGEPSPATGFRRCDKADCARDAVAGSNFEQIARPRPRARADSVSVRDRRVRQLVSRNRRSSGRASRSLSAIGTLLGSDDVFEPSHMNHDTADLLVDTTASQHFEWDIAAASISEFAQDIDRAVGGHPRRTPERPQRLRVQLDRESARLIISHPADSQPGTEFPKRTGQPSQIRGTALRNAVDVTRRPRRSVRSCTQAANQDVFDVISIEDGEDSSGIERFVSHRAERQIGSR